VKSRQSALSFPTFSTCIHTTKGSPYRSEEVLFEHADPEYLPFRIKRVFAVEPA
jgi:hypothetical protein